MLIKSEIFENLIVDDNVLKIGNIPCENGILKLKLIGGKTVNCDSNKAKLLTLFRTPNVPVVIRNLSRIRFIKVTNKTRVNFNFIIDEHVMTFDRALYSGPGLRIVPCYPYISVDKAGNCFDTIGLTPVNKRMAHSGYLIISRRLNIPVHRLVALAWCKNGDICNNFIVNHKDSNPTNNNSENLEWCSYRDNTIHAAKVNDSFNAIEVKVRDFYTGDILIFKSIGELNSRLGLNIDMVIEIDSRLPQKLWFNRYEIKRADDFTPWFYENRDKVVKNGKRVITVTYPDGEIKEFLDNRDFLKYYSLWNVSCGIDSLVKKFKQLYPELTVNVTELVKYTSVQARHVETGVVVKYPSIKAACRACGVGFSTVRLIVKYNKPNCVNGYMFRYDAGDKDWSDPVYAVYNKPIVAVGVKSSNEIVFSSKRETARKLNVNRQVVNYAIKTQVPIKGYILNYMLQ